MFDVGGVVVREVLVGGVLFVGGGLFFVCVHLTLKAVWWVVGCLHVKSEFLNYSRFNLIFFFQNYPKTI